MRQHVLINLIGRMKPGQSHDLTDYDMREAARDNAVSTYVASLEGVRVVVLQSGNWRITKL